MVLRCSLLGHDYGDPEVDREREERGSEVVVTVREYEKCARCGDEHVVSENTEVTSLSAETAADSRPDRSPPEPTPEPGDDAAFVDADAAESTPAEPDADDADDEDELEIPTDENGDPVTDDGEILEDDADDETRDRGRGEWPDSDDVGPPVGAENEPAEWPDDESESLEDDAVLLETDATADDAGDAEVAAGTPAAGTATSETDPGPGTGIERAEAAPTPGTEGGTPAEGVPTEFYCPRCEFVASSDRGSLRTGDICPDCRKGYLGERRRR